MSGERAASASTPAALRHAPEVVRERVEAFLNRRFPARRVRRVLLVNPPDADATLFRFATARRGRYPNYPPYGLLLLAAQLRAIGVEARVTNLNHEVLRCCHDAVDEAHFDFDASWQRALAAELAAFKPDLAGVTCMFTMTHAAFVQVCRRVVQGGVPLAIGGVHVTNDLERVVRDVGVANVAFTGEADRSFTTFVQVVNRELPAETLGQVVLIDRGGNGGAPACQQLLGDARPTAQEISQLPAYDLIDLPQYSRYGTVGSFYFLKPRDARFATVLSNRGCRAQCTFCSVRSFNGAGVRTRSVSSVVDELALLRQEYGVGHVMWLDDDLFYDHRRSLALFNELAKRNLGVTWDASNGVLASSCTEEMIAAAAASGCIALTIGMESGDAEILRAIRKPATVDVLLRAAEVLRRHEQILASVFLMIGFPNETMRKIWATIAVARQMDLDWYKITQLQPLPNTPLYDAMVEQGLITPAAAAEVRYSVGGYGKQNEVEQGVRPSAHDVSDVFASIPPDAVPTAAQLTDVWFFMNYHLNFHRLFAERRAAKVVQLRAQLRNLADVVAPEHGFALYFQGYLQHQVEGRIDPAIIARLRERLRHSGYWRRRLAAFGLALEDLERGVFPDAGNGSAMAARVERRNDRVSVAGA
jgi:radical SAM superfamily enzyme YgiQ (UPF0313 family)